MLFAPAKTRSSLPPSIRRGLHDAVPPIMLIPAQVTLDATFEDQFPADSRNPFDKIPDDYSSPPADYLLEVDKRGAPRRPLCERHGCPTLWELSSRRPPFRLHLLCPRGNHSPSVARLRHIPSPVMLGQMGNRSRTIPNMPIPVASTDIVTASPLAPINPCSPPAAMRDCKGKLALGRQTLATSHWPTDARGEHGEACGRCRVGVDRGNRMRRHEGLVRRLGSQ